jgi:hypothetical protein
LKAILHGFELASGLKVNFYKSSIMGVNVSSDFLGVAERFLHCIIGSIHFIYLGLHVGENHRKLVVSGVVGLKLVFLEEVFLF